MGKTSIEWADHSINPLRARNIETGKTGHFCEKISAGCKNCYASKMQSPYLTQLEYVVENREKVDLFLEEKVLQEVLRRKKPTRYFWCDMTDMFLEDYHMEWIDRCFAVMALTPWHVHMVLTKRANRLLRWSSRKFLAGDVQMHANDLRNIHRLPFAAALQRKYKLPPEEQLDISDVDTWPLPNVWLGVSVEDQKNKDRIDHLRETPAAVRFLSLEPLLEDLGALDLRGIDWVIVGGESGPGARPFDIRWARDTIAQCKAAGTSCFIKQLGARPEGPHGCGDCDPCMVGQPCMLAYNVGMELKDRKGGDWDEWSEDLRVRQFPGEAESDMERDRR